MMTQAATRFVGPLTFEAITRHEVITDQWKPGANADIEHIARGEAGGVHFEGFGGERGAVDRGGAGGGGAVDVD